jgi:hypothetical protein
MKKILAVLLLFTVAACNEQKAQELKTASGGCDNIKAVNDTNDGKIYYAPNHRLYQHVKINKELGDRNYCSVQEASSAGYKPAPQQFADSTAKLIDCLDAGGCQNYVVGIYQSLRIYDKVCAPADISPDTLAGDVRSYTGDNPSQADVEKFYGVTSALLDKYPCPSIMASRNKNS